MIYAIYRGDDFLFVGTRRECADYLEVKPDTITFYLSNSYKKRFTDDTNRIIVIKVEE